MYDSPKYRPADESLVEEFLHRQRHATFMSAAPGAAPAASILPYVLLPDGVVELHCVRTDPTFVLAGEHPHVSLLVSDFLAYTPHHWVDPVAGSEATLHFEAVLLTGVATTTTDVDEVAAAMARLLATYGHGPAYEPIADGERYGDDLRRLGIVRIRITDRQAKFKVGTGDLAQRLDVAQRLRGRDEPGDARAAAEIERLAPRLVPPDA